MLSITWEGFIPCSISYLFQESSKPGLESLQAVSLGAQYYLGNSPDAWL